MKLSVETLYLCTTFPNRKKRPLPRVIESLIGINKNWVQTLTLGKIVPWMWIQVWRLLILIFPFNPAPSDVSKEGVGPSMRQDMLLSVDSPLKWDLKEKKKVVSIGGLLLDKDHFNVLHHYFSDPPIPHTSTPEFHASTPPSIFNETYIPVEQGTHKGNLPLDHWDIYRIQEVEHGDVNSLNIFFNKESNEYFSYCIGAFVPEWFIYICI